MEAQARFFAHIAPKNKKKKKSKTQKKYDEIKKMLEASTKFFSVVKKPDRSYEHLQHVLNATRVLMEPAGLCSTDGAANKYKSWPDYCKTHKFISSLSGSLPDMILPKYFATEFPEITDVMMNKKKGEDYQTTSGLKRMSRRRPDYPLNDDVSSENQGGDGEGLEGRSPDDEMMEHESGGETMDEEDTSKTQFDKLFEGSAKPVIFDGKKKKDKSIKCRKCFKGGHEDVHCPI